MSLASSKRSLSLGVVLVALGLLFANPASGQSPITFRAASQAVSTVAPAPAFQAAGTALGGTGSVTPTWPAHQADDVALLFIESTGGQAANLSVPAGFAPALNSPQSTGAGTAGTRLTVYWARATSSSMPAPTVQDPGNHVYARILTYRGVIKAGNPWDVTGGGVKTPATGTVTVTGVTTNVVNTLIVQAVARDNDNAAAAFSAQTNANLTGIAERSDAGTTQGNGGGIGVWDGVMAAAGATGNTTANVTSSINAFLTIALKSPEEILTIAKPAGTVQDDVMVASIAVRPSTLAINAPFGWNPVRRMDNANPNANSLVVYWKLAGPAEPASYSWGLVPNSTGAVGGIQTFYNVDIASPILVEDGQNTLNDVNHATPSVTTTIANAMLVTSHAFSSSATWAFPTGMNEGIDVASLAVPNSGGISLEGNYVLQAAAGATGAKTATASNDSDVGNAHILALKPAPPIGAVACASSAGNSTLDLPGVNLSGRNAVVVFVGYNNDGNETVTSVVIDPGGASQTDMGASLAAANNLDDAQIYIFGAVNPPQGTFTIRVTFNTSLLGNRGSNVCAYPLSGVNTLAPFGTPGTNFADSANGNVTVPSAAGELVLAGLAGETIGPSTVALPAVADADVQGGSGTTVHHLATAHRDGAAPNVTFNWSHLNDHWAAAGISVRLAGPVPTPGGFNGFETGTGAGAVTGVILTKVAGVAFSLDVVAIEGGAQQSGFTDAVIVELLGNNTLGVPLDAQNCPTSSTVVQTVAPNPVIAGGRSTVSFAAVANSWRDVRVRVRWPTSSPTVTACSTDNFAIRPASFSVVVTDATWDTAGVARALNNTGASGGNVHKAGQPFTITVTPAPGTTTNYAGDPTVSALACTLPAPCANGTLSLGAFAGSGTRVSNTATYSEAGAFDLTLVDQTFASVDSADGTPADCSGTGRFVCQSGAPLAVGRFVPDRFALAVATAPVFRTFDKTDAACTVPPAGPRRSFTYIGQFFGYQTQPVATITAQNASGGTTTNYRGTLWKLTGASASQAFANTPVMALDTTQILAPTVTETPDTGTGTLTANVNDKLAFTRSITPPPAAPFNANLSLTVSVSDASEAGASQGTIGTATPLVFDGGGAGISFDSGNAFRYGRLRLSSANGSQLVPLPVPLETQYWAGAPTNAFLTNAADNCTTLSATNNEMNNFQGNLGPIGPCKTTLNDPITFTGGRGNLRLTAPGSGNHGSVDLTVHLAAGSGSTCPPGAPPSQSVTGANQLFLQGNWTGSNFDQNPSARASFGVFPGAQEVIFIRENF